MTRGRKPIKRSQLAAERFKSAKTIFDKSYEKLVEDERWGSLVGIFDPRTLREWVRKGMPQNRIAGVAEYFGVSGDFFTNQAIEASMVERKLFAAQAHLKSPKIFPPENESENLENISRPTKNIIETLIDLATFRLKDQDRFLKDSSCYVIREKAEKWIVDLLEKKRKWISVEGKAGTGKSTLLHKIHEKILQQPIFSDESLIPLFVDLAWFKSKHGFESSPIGLLKQYLPDTISTVWDMAIALSATLERRNSKLILFLDTVDAELISNADSRVVTFLGTEIYSESLGVVSACRPVEADACLPVKRRRVRLPDFSETEALKAIDSYVAAYYRHLTPAARVESCNVLRKYYLTNPRFADICKRPVSLRMMFEAYPDRYPPEVINRNQLYAVYWRTKIVGENVHRPFKADPSLRIDFVNKLTLYMVNNASVIISANEVDSFWDFGMEALYDLISEGVLNIEGKIYDRTYSFFHQSFLEYAAARAFLKLDDMVIREKLTALLQPLADRSRSVWFDLLQEVAVWAQEINKAWVTQRILETLKKSTHPGAFTKAGMIWCHLKNTASLDTTALDEPQFQRACLENLHNATIKNIEYLLEHLVRPVWISGAHDDRYAVMHAWENTIPLAPGQIKAQISELGVQNSLIHHEEYSVSLRATYVSQFIKVIVAFIGADDKFAVNELSALYKNLQKAEFPKTTIRATLVKEVAKRRDLSEKVPSLLYTWMCQPEYRISFKKVRDLRQAFAVALSSIPISKINVKKEIDWICADQPENIPDDQISDTRKRILTVWKYRVTCGNPNEAEFIQKELGRLIAQTSAPAVLNDIFNAFIKPLASEGYEFIFDLLIRIFALKSPINTLKKDISIQTSLAFQHYVTNRENAQRIAEISGILEIPFSKLLKEQAALLAKCLPFLPKSQLASTLDQIEQENATLIFLSNLVEPTLPNAINKYIKLNFKKDQKKEEIKRLSQVLIRFAPFLPAETCRAAVKHLLQHAEKPHRFFWPAFKAITPLVRCIPDEDNNVKNAIIDTLLEFWHKGKSDHYLFAVLSTIKSVLAEYDIPKTMAERILAQCAKTLKGPEEFLEARRLSYEIIELVSGRFAQNFSQLLESIVKHDLKRCCALSMNDLCGLAAIVYHLTDIIADSAFHYSISIAECAESLQASYTSWRKLMAILVGSFQRYLGITKLRAILITDIGDYPDFLQKEILRIGQQNNDQEFFEKIPSALLGKKARQQFEKWGLALAKRKNT